MANILFAWELGQGLGHIAVLRPLAERLQARGHRVMLALRDLTSGHEAYVQSGIPVFQAPHLCGRVRQPVAPPLCTFAHVLHNTALGDVNALRGLACGWHTLFDHLQPDAVVFDHSPSCLVAATAWHFKKILVGTGFCCPPVVSPFPNWRPSSPKTAEQLCLDEQRVLDNVNLLTQRWNVSLNTLAQLYQQADQMLLTTVPELDHFPERPTNEVNYYGCWSAVGGQAAHWPAGRGPKLFAYLKPFPELPATLAWLRQAECRTVAFVPGANNEMHTRFAGGNLALVPQPVDLNDVAQQCDAAILHGGHGATVYFLLHGRPLVLIPTQLEQRLTTDRVAQLELGLGASQNSSPDIQRAIQRLICQLPRFQSRAVGFAGRYNALRSTDQADRATEAISNLLA